MLRNGLDENRYAVELLLAIQTYLAKKAPNQETADFVKNLSLLLPATALVASLNQYEAPLFGTIRHHAGTSAAFRHACEKSTTLDELKKIVATQHRLFFQPPSGASLQGEKTTSKKPDGFTKIIDTFHKRLNGR